METLKVMGLDGPAYDRTQWAVVEGGENLDLYDTRKKAISMARSRWARPGQKIKVVSTTGKVEVIREGDPSKQRQRGGGGWGGGGLPGTGGNGGGGGLFGGGGGGWF